MLDGHAKLSTLKLAHLRHHANIIWFIHASQVAASIQLTAIWGLCKWTIKQQLSDLVHHSYLAHVTAPIGPKMCAQQAVASCAVEGSRLAGAAKLLAGGQRWNDNPAQ
jgi:hypothetical protein